MSNTSKSRPRAGIYCRASSDPKERGLSVETQEEDARKWCEENGYSVAWVIVDNDYSASLWAPKDRPGYTKVQTNLAGADPVDALVARDHSRLQRDLEVYVQVRALCARYGVKWVYNGRIYDLNRTDDRFTTGLDALLAERRASEIRDDVMLAIRKRVRTGRPHGRITYGYRAVYDPHTGIPVAREEDPETGPLVKEMVSRFLAGESLYAITADMNRRGIPTPHTVGRWRRGLQGPSQPWNSVTVRKVICNPAYAGLRVYQGRVVGKAAWPALISESDHYEIVARLSDPARATTNNRETKHLLSGVAVCGECNGTIHVFRNRDYATYRCIGQGGTARSGAYCVVRKVSFVDAYVTETILRRLERSDAAELFAEGPDEEAAEAARELERLEDRLEAFRRSAEDPNGISPETLARMEAKYLPMIEAARQRSVPRQAPPPVRDLATTANPRHVWDSLSIADHRAVVRYLVRVKIIKTRKRGSHVFDPESVQIEWLSGH